MTQIALSRMIWGGQPDSLNSKEHRLLPEYRTPPVGSVLPPAAARKDR